MKIWFGHGSEHSANLALIGHFSTESDANLAAQRFKELAELASEQPEPSWDNNEEWFDRATSERVQAMQLWQIGPLDLDNFRYDFTPSTRGTAVTIETEEYDILGFIKVMLILGARIEIYSRHEWTASGEPIGGRTEDTDAEDPDAEDTEA